MCVVSYEMISDAWLCKEREHQSSLRERMANDMCLRGRPEGMVGGDGGVQAAFHTQRCIFVRFCSSYLTTTATSLEKFTLASYKKAVKLRLRSKMFPTQSRLQSGKHVFLRLCVCSVAVDVMPVLFLRVPSAPCVSSSSDVTVWRAVNREAPSIM